MAIVNLEVEVSRRKEVLLDVMCAVGDVRDIGILQDIVYLAQRVNAIPKDVHFLFFESRGSLGEYWSNQLRTSLYHLENEGKVLDVSPRHNLVIAPSEKSREVKYIDAERVIRIKNIPINKLQSMAMAVQLAEFYEVDLNNENLSEECQLKLSELFSASPQDASEFHAEYMQLF